MLKAEFIEHKAFSSKINIYDVDKFNLINDYECLKSIRTCDKSEYMKVQNIKIIETRKDYFIVENFL
mgnify:FL=1